MNDIISIIAPVFPSEIKVFDEAYCSKTIRQVRTLSVTEANAHPAAVKYGIKVIAACWLDATNDAYEMFVGIDRAGIIYHTSLQHGQSSWFGLSEEERERTELEYEMVFNWCQSGADGPMPDEYWADLASIGVDESSLHAYHVEY